MWVCGFMQGFSSKCPLPFSSTLSCVQGGTGEPWSGMWHMNSVPVCGTVVFIRFLTICNLLGLIAVHWNLGCDSEVLIFIWLFTSDCIIQTGWLKQRLKCEIKMWVGLMATLWALWGGACSSAISCLLLSRLPVHMMSSLYKSLPTCFMRTLEIMY